MVVLKVPKLVARTVDSSVVWSAQKWVVDLVDRTDGKLEHRMVADLAENLVALWVVKTATKKVAK